MSDLYLQSIYIYPIKSLGGISLTEAQVQKRGLKYDRHWLLTDLAGHFLTQRTCAEMALLQVTLTPSGLLISHKKNLLTPLSIPFEASTKKEVSVTIWDDTCTAIEVSNIANDWFSAALHMPVQLVYMPDDTQRLVDQDYAAKGETVGFADAFPFMMIGQSSLDDLNNRLHTPLPMNRFRPNLVFSGGSAYCEDTIHTCSIGEITFTAAKPCARCVVTTIDQEQAIKGAEPLKTLSTYRTIRNKVMFGQNLLHTGTGTIKVGDKLVVHQWK